MDGFTTASIERFRSRVSDELRGARSVEDAAQRLAEGIHEAFSPAVVLARVFVTQPFARLPADIAALVRSLARSNGIEDTLRDDLPVLTLVGTRGALPAWNDRRQSQTHAGIPLAGKRFVESMPMITRLFQELGVDLGWFDDEGAVVARRFVGSVLSGTFYVGDAVAAADASGRRVITASDFVAAHDVKSVFGMGGAYVSGALTAVMVFSRQKVERSMAERFALLISPFKAATSQLVSSDRVFAAP